MSQNKNQFVSIKDRVSNAFTESITVIDGDDFKNGTYGNPLKRKPAPVNSTLEKGENNDFNNNNQNNDQNQDDQQQNNGGGKFFTVKGKHIALKSKKQKEDNSQQ